MVEAYVQYVWTKLDWYKVLETNRYLFIKNKKNSSNSIGLYQQWVRNAWLISSTRSDHFMTFHPKLAQLSYLLRSKMLSTRLLNYTNPNCWKRKTMASSKEVDLENYDNTSTSKMVLTPRKVQSSRSKCKNCITLVFSSIGVVFLLLSYIICGAIVFSNIEGNYSRHRGT